MTLLLRRDRNQRRQHQRQPPPSPASSRHLSEAPVPDHNPCDIFRLNIQLWALQVHQEIASTVEHRTESSALSLSPLALTPILGPERSPQPPSPSWTTLHLTPPSSSFIRRLPNPRRPSRDQTHSVISTDSDLGSEFDLVYPPHPLADLDINSPTDGDVFPVVYWNDDRLHERVEDQLVRDYINTLWGYFSRPTRDEEQRSRLIDVYAAKLEKRLDELDLPCVIFY